MPKGPMSEEHKAALREGKRKAREAKAAQPVHTIEPFRHATTVQVTYRPFDGDPHSVTWNGVKFRANVPIELSRDNTAHYVEQLLPKQFPGLNGEINTKHMPAKVFMGDMAKTNPSFEVDGHRERKKVNSRIVPPPGAEWTDVHEGEISYSSRLDDVA